MSRKLNIFSGRQFLDANGVPYSGAQLFTYTAGTSTKTTLTQDQAGTSNHSNPIILNSKGEPADSGGTAVPMWQADGESVKLVLAPSTDTDPPIAAISTWDNLEGVNDTSNSGGGSEWVTGATPTYVSATSFTVPGDLTTTYHVGRRLKTTNSGGMVYSTITAVAYTTLTTITVVNDDGASLDSGLSAVYYSILSSLNNAVPANVNTFKNITTQPDVDGGAADAYTANVAETSYTINRVYSVQIATTNTGASTLNLDSLGVKNIKLIDGTDPLAGYLYAGMIAKFLYDGTNMVLLNPNRIAVPFTQTDIGAAAVGQGELKTTTGEVSTTSATGINSTLPGGEYGFYPNLKGSLTGAYYDINLMNSAVNLSSSYTAAIFIKSDGTHTVYAQQRYLQASPPYNLGDGDIPLFMFVMIDNNTNEVLATYAATEAPWHYNGPTDIRADRIDRYGKRFQNVRDKSHIPPIAKTSIGYQAYLNAVKNAPMIEREITKNIKNADMNLIPHPWFAGNDLTGKTVVMIDPVSSLASDLADIINDPDMSVTDILHNYLNIGNTPLQRSGPNGLMIVSANWK